MSADVRLMSVRKPAGYWCLGGAMGLRMAIYTRPRWLTRAICRALLEWEWRDEP